MKSVVGGMERAIFASRWLQAPLYLGLIAAQGVYIYKFFRELIHLVVDANTFNDTQIMLIVLDLIDVVLVANLIVMVVVGGYETFVSRLSVLDEHPDRPEWISHVDASGIKTKLLMALVSISSIHLLRTFMGLGGMATGEAAIDATAVAGQVAIQITFLISVLAMAWIDRMGKSH
ncbi:TIGR00645 family protein [Methylovirgula sp. 4M-Z18]|uniref:TIGR00645 family protein n=1 Tax=Methylovirgula sp. 4M-Z18 TaxID=2293567 RepID=UPI000E2EE309|nr:TIGR00645 family protein [Methylovirgula sp. 4M-Z18]RFB78134.1 TIGR00645 family protein [Methylovirgula sp. 4M-Z18]